MTVLDLTDAERVLLAKYRLCDEQKQLEVQALIQSLKGEKENPDTSNKPSAPPQR